MVGVLVAAALAGIVWATLDKKQEKRRKAFGKVSVTLRNYGLVRLPSMLEDYSVGDYSGFYKGFYKFADMLDDGDEVVLKEFDSVFNRVLDIKLKTPEGLALLKAKIAALTPAATPVAQ